MIDTEKVVLVYSDEYRLPVSIPYIVQLGATPAQNKVYVNVTDFVEMNQYGKYAINQPRNYNAIMAAIVAGCVSYNIVTMGAGIPAQFADGMILFYASMLERVINSLVHMDPIAKEKVRYLACEFALVQMYGTEDGLNKFQRYKATYFPKLSKMITDSLDDQFKEDSFDRITTFLEELARQYPSMRGLKLFNVYEKWLRSIFTALKSGADFEALAKKYGQTGEKQWLTSSMYENAPSVDADSKAYLTALTTLAPNESQNVAFSQGNIIVQVTNRKAMVTKYDAAVIKHTIDFSKDTYSQAYNKFSQYVSENKTLEGLEKNAQKFGFRVQERKDIFSSEHYVAGLRSTRDAMKWIFDAKEGDVSPLYECGNNDHLMVVALTKIHPEGYRDLSAVEDQLKQEVIRDKKYNKAVEMLKGVNSIDAAKQKGAVVDSVRQITFSAPVFVQATGTSEPALSGAVAAAKAGQFSAAPVKGNGGAFLFKVLNKKQREAAKFDAKQQQAQLKQQAMQAASRFMNELYLKADVVDNRYLFF